MPYIITAKTGRAGTAEQDPYAVASLEEARDAAYYEIRKDDPKRDDSVDFDRAERTAQTLPESGGTIGPLPDGYVIDVRRVSWGELSELAGPQYRARYALSDSAILDAYNGST